MQCFAFQSFKTVQGSAEEAERRKGKMRLKMPPKSEVQTAQQGNLDLPREQWSDTAGPTRATEPTAWLLNSSPQRAVLWARAQWKITARKSSGTKRPLGLRPCSRHRASVMPLQASVLQEQLAAAPQCWPQRVPASRQPLAPPRALQCLKLHVGALCHSCPTFLQQPKLKAGGTVETFFCIYFFPSSAIFLYWEPKYELPYYLFPASIILTAVDLTQTFVLQNSHKSCNNSIQ